MAIANSYQIPVDIKQPRLIEKPNITVNDLADFTVTVMDKDTVLPLTGLVKAELMNIRPDLAVVTIPGVVSGNNIRFDLSKSPATSIPGEVRAAIQLTFSNGKITSMQFPYEVHRDPSSYHQPTPLERGLIQVVLEDGPVVIANAKKAVTDANAALATANQANTTAAKTIADTNAVKLATEAVRTDTLAAKSATEAATSKANQAAANADSTASGAAAAAQRVSETAAAAAQQTAGDASTYARQKADAAAAYATEVANVEFEKIRTNANRAIDETKDYSDRTIYELQQKSSESVDMAYKASVAANEVIDRAGTAAVRAEKAAGGVEEATAAANTSAAYANEQGNYAKRIADENKTKFLAPVDKFADLATRYPTPGEGDTVKVTSEAKMYRFSSGAWLETDRYNPAAIDELASKVYDTSRQTQLLQNGANVLNVDVATPVDFEVQGRTLVSLANSNLEALKYYALADKKTKIAVDNTVIAGVGKFQKKSTTLTTADFVGKVSGSTTANPHVSKHNSYGTETALLNPANFASESSANGYSSINTLNGANGIIIATRNAVNAQHLFSFNIIEQIERQLGLIPKATIAEKVQWVKDNVNSLRANWHGFGSSVGGNKATFVMWSSATSQWAVAPASHTGGAVAKLAVTQTDVNIQYRLDANGFVHYLAYAEPSDGTTASTINTDFINLEIELKATAQLNTRGRIIRVENFEGKVGGSNAENPHIARYRGSTTLPDPGVGTEFITSGVSIGYDKIISLNGETAVVSTPGAGTIGSHMFSFNLIEAVERNIGKIPAADVAGKVAWLKANVGKYTGKWNGFGSSVNGNKASLAVWLGSSWYTGYTHFSGGVSSLHYPNTNTAFIDSSGFVHFIAYAEPSDGVINSALRTDYVELEIELKPDADFRNPKVPLYEVAKEDFDKIGTTWTDEDTLKRFPIVEGPQHLVNPYLMAEGENLFKGFHEGYTLAGSTVESEVELISPYEMKFKPAATAKYVIVMQEVIPNQNYSISSELTNVNMAVYDESASTIILPYAGGTTARTFNAGNRSKIRIYFYVSPNQTEGTFKNLMLNIGTIAKPFTPRNPSYLFAETKLGAIGTAKDTLFRQDGQWKRRKVIEKDLFYDGTLNWAFGYQIKNFKTVYTTSIKAVGLEPLIVKPSGKNLKPDIYKDYSSMANEDTFISATASTVFSILDSESGWISTFTPTTSDIKRYFNGWKYTDGVTWTSVTGNGQTATAQQALDTKPTDYTPYKLSYVLATPVIENVTVEGEIIADGLTQIETGSGLIVREKVTPFVDASKFSYIGAQSLPTSHLKQRPKQFINIYKNGETDIHNWVKKTANVQGLERYELPPEKLDTTAEYTVTYQALDKPKLTVNPVDLKAVFAKNIRSAVDDIANRFGDAATRLSIAERAIVDLYVKLKALGAK